MTPAQKAQQTAYNEFIADYVERHGECKATRDEAHEMADWVVSLAKDVVYICGLHAKPSAERDDAATDLVYALIADNGDIDGKDEARFLAACAIAAALEVDRMIPRPANYEQSLSLLTFAIGCIENHAPTTKDEADRLYRAVQRLDRSAVKASGNLKEERESPVPVQAWDIHESGHKVMLGVGPDLFERFLFISRRPLEVLLSNGQTVIVRAKK